MANKIKTEELNETELGQVTGGASIGDIKPSLTSSQGIRATKGSKVASTMRGTPDGISKVIGSTAGKGEI